MSLSPRQRGLLFGLILVLRIAYTSEPQATYDFESYSIVAQAAAAGQNIYGATARYNYSPFWSWILRALWALAGSRPLVFMVFIGLLLNLADAASAWVLHDLALRQGLTPDQASRASLLFFANPLSVLVSCYQRQFDGLSILFLLLALRLASGKGGGAKWSTSLCLTVSLWIKHVTAVQPLLFWRRRPHGTLPWYLVLGPYALFLLAFVPYLGESGSILDHVLLYGTGLRGSQGQRPAGISTWITFGSHGRLIDFSILALGVGLTAWWSGSRTLPRASLLVMLSQIVFAPAFAAQYLIWPIALGSLAASGGYALLTTVGALLIVTEARLVGLPFAVSAAAAWTAALLWFLQEAGAGFGSRAAAFGVHTSNTASG